MQAAQDADQRAGVLVHDQPQAEDERTGLQGDVAVELLAGDATNGSRSSSFSDGQRRVQTARRNSCSLPAGQPPSGAAPASRSNSRARARVAVTVRRHERWIFSDESCAR
ncbi:MAG: hypothetical protein GYA57_18800 [Myxococcales bacterium]|nr:hypothetical protein [Myxococcales bacterium]